MNFIHGDFPRRIYRSDNWKSLENAAKAIGLAFEPSQPGQSETNGLIESINGTIERMSRKAQLQAGMPACWWSYAAPFVRFLESVIMNKNNECAYYEKHGVHFPGKVIPFGCLVYFMPSPTRDDRHKAEPALQAGVFLGYRQGPGGIWQGDYIVAPLEHFEGIPLHARTEGTASKNVEPHITRTLEWSPMDYMFPSSGSMSWKMTRCRESKNARS